MKSCCLLLLSFPKLASGTVYRSGKTSPIELIMAKWAGSEVTSQGRWQRAFEFWRSLQDRTLPFQWILDTCQEPFWNLRPKLKINTFGLNLTEVEKLKIFCSINQVLIPLNLHLESLQSYNDNLVNRTRYFLANADTPVKCPYSAFLNSSSIAKFFG